MPFVCLFSRLVLLSLSLCLFMIFGPTADARESWNTLTSYHAWVLTLILLRECQLCEDIPHGLLLVVFTKWYICWVTWPI